VRAECVFLTESVRRSGIICDSRGKRLRNEMQIRGLPGGVCQLKRPAGEELDSASSENAALKVE
jgi:hypothetical protein